MGSKKQVLSSITIVVFVLAGLVPLHHVRAQSSSCLLPPLLGGSVQSGDWDDVCTWHLPNAPCEDLTNRAACNPNTCVETADPILVHCCDGFEPPDPLIPLTPGAGDGAVISAQTTVDLQHNHTGPYLCVAAH